MKNKIRTALEFLWYSTFINSLLLLFVHFTTGIHSVSILLFSIPLLATSLYFVHYYFSEALKDFKKVFNSL
jgi:hypothetical protein